MTETPDLRELLLTYKLGKLSSKDREKLDEQILGNQDFSDRLAEAEYDLIDDYQNGNLTRAQRRNMEMAFSPEELRRGLASATGFSDKPIPAPPHAGLLLARSAAVAASVLAVAAGLLVIYLHKPQSRPPLAKTENPPASLTASASPGQNSKTTVKVGSAVAVLLLEPSVARGTAGSVLVLAPSVHAVHVQWVIPPAIAAQSFSLSVTKDGKVLTTIDQQGAPQNAGGSQVAEFDFDSAVFARYPENTHFLFVVCTSGQHGTPVGEYPVSLHKSNAKSSRN